MRKIDKKHSTAIAQGMYVFTILAFILVAMLFGSCSSSVDRDNYEEQINNRTGYAEIEYESLKIAQREYIKAFTFEGRRYTVWTNHKTSQLLHIESNDE